MSTEVDGLEWYALFVRCRKEEHVTSLLEKMGYHVFLPLGPRRVIHRGQRLTVMRPLFPGYLFVELDLCRDNRLRILRLPDVVRIVGYGDRPAPIPREQVESLQRAVERKAPLEPCPYMQEGQKVRIVAGPFKDLVGILAEKRSKTRLVLNIDVMGRAVSFFVDPAYVEPYY